MNQSKTKIYFIISLFLVFVFQTFTSFGQIPDEILLSLQAGNAKELSKYFNDNVELTVLDKEDVNSRAQAQQIVGAFFSKVQPESFEKLHDGGKEDGAFYVIGQLFTKEGQFRVYFLIKQNDEESYIHQLRIENIDQ